MNYESTLDAIRHEMTAEENIERRCDSIIRELDEFMAMAADRETIDLIERETRSFGQMQTRVQLILSFLATREPTKFRIVRNG